MARFCIQSLIGASDERRNLWGQAQEILRVPSVEGLGLGLERATTEQGVVNRATGQPRHGGFFDKLKIFALVKGDECQVFADVVQEQEGRVASDAPLAGHRRERGVYLGKTVGSATGVHLAKAQEQIEAGGVVLMIAVKGGDKHGGVEERVHWASSGL